jgi:hypothetical protein
MTSSGGVMEMDIPFDGMDDAAEAQGLRIEEAKGELADEAIEDLGPPPAPPEVTGILEKYGNDPAKLAQAYRSLQQEFNRIKQGGAPAAPPAEEAPATPAPAEEAIEAVADMPAPEVVQQMKTALHGAAGGEDRFRVVQEWVMNNMPPGRITAYNAALQSGKVDDAVTSYKAMQYDYLMANGYEGRMVGGRVPRGGEVSGFASEGEMINAMADPRYSPQSAQFDESYHLQVHQRIAASA